MPTFNQIFSTFGEHNPQLKLEHARQLLGVFNIDVVSLKSDRYMHYLELSYDAASPELYLRYVEPVLKNVLNDPNAGVNAWIWSLDDLMTFTGYTKRKIRHEVSQQNYPTELSVRNHWYRGEILSYYEQLSLFKDMISHSMLELDLYVLNYLQHGGISYSTSFDSISNSETCVA